MYFEILGLEVLEARYVRDPRLSGGWPKTRFIYLLLCLCFLVLLPVTCYGNSRRFLYTIRVAVLKLLGYSVHIITHLSATCTLALPPFPRYTAHASVFYITFTMAAVINRSVTSLHNELEFLFESEVISQALYDDICNKIPRKLTPGQKLDLPGSQVVGIAEVTERVAAVQITPAAPSPPVAVHPASAGSGGKVEALYDYVAQDPTDLALVKGDQIDIIEKLNNDWWKGRGPSGKEGIFLPTTSRNCLILPTWLLLP